MAKVSKSIVIDAPKKKIYDVITDFKRYPEFLPETKSVSIDKHRGNHSVVTFTVQVIKQISYTLDMTGTPPNGMHWTLIKGDMMKSNTGRWILEPSGKHATKATYEVDIELDLPVPSSMTKALVSKDLPKMLERFKERIEGM